MTDSGQTENFSSNTGQQVAAPETKSEGMVPQSKMNEVLHARTRESHDKGYEKGRAEALAELERQREQAQVQQQPSAGSLGGMQQLTPEQVRKMIVEQTEQLRQEELHKKSIGDFVSKVQTGMEKYSDFETKVAKLNLPNNLPIVHLANAMDNTADVIYELANNPHMVGNLLSLLAHQGTAHLALSEMQRLSSSIKNNQAASKIQSANPPLSQVKPSTAGTDSGAMTIDDYRNADYLRA